MHLVKWLKMEVPVNTCYEFKIYYCQHFDLFLRFLFGCGPELHTNLKKL